MEQEQKSALESYPGWEFKNDNPPSKLHLASSCRVDVAISAAISTNFRSTLVYLIALLTCVFGLPDELPAAEKRTSDRLRIRLPLDAATDRQNKPFGADPSSVIAPSSEAWQQYEALWKAHHADHSDSGLRRELQIPASGSRWSSQRRGRIAPSVLKWRPGSWNQTQSQHFEILSRAGELEAASLNRAARQLESIYRAWTQVFFPFWRDARVVTERWNGWDPSKETPQEFMGRQSRRFDTRFRKEAVRPVTRHRVVLLANQLDYQTLISRREISGRSGVIAGATSTGFYSDTLRLSFFVVDGKRQPPDNASDVSLDPTWSHEICHQLFQEATSSPQRSMVRSSRQSLAETSDDLWLIEGIAGFFESLQFSDGFATVGGWESERLQPARYRTLVAMQPIPAIESLMGNQSQVIARTQNPTSTMDLATWYSQAIVQTHLGMCRQPAKVLRRLASIYRVPVADSLGSSWHRSEAERANRGSLYFSQDQVIDFLILTDADVIDEPIGSDAKALNLAGCELTRSGLAAIPPQTNLEWLELSGLSARDQDVMRLVSQPHQLKRLGLEATDVTPALTSWLKRCVNLEELDLSWTLVDDSLGDIFHFLPNLNTLWLTGSKVTDTTIEKLKTMAALRTLDIQRTATTEHAARQLQLANPALSLNPLSIQ